MIFKLQKYFYFFAILAIFGLFLPAVSLAARLQLDYQPAAFTVPASLKIETLETVENLPWQWQAITPAFSYSLVSSGLYDPSRPLEVKIYYDKNDNRQKKIFAYDALSNFWQPLSAQDFPQGKYLQTSTNSLSGRLIVMANSEVLSVGSASWYKYKNGLFAASPDFAKGSVLRVYNLSNNKFVDVTINDYGPDRKIHPDRVIDLDYEAFKKIASPSAGLIKVKIEPLKIAGEEKLKLALPAGSVPTITASSAVVVLEKTGAVLWGKNADQVAPLASLTKLVALKVFLDTNPDLKKVVTYQYQDEKYNYQYCRPWESARLLVKEGETMTIKDLLYSAAVGSANNAIESLVRVSGLKRADFIKIMNETVKNWGASSTKFVEPTGLSPDNVSSPLDYAIITKEIFLSPLLKTLTTTARYNFKTINTKKNHTLINTNQLLREKTYSIIGTKTGYLDEAGYCLMTRLATPQGNLIIINFGSQTKAANFYDNQQLIRYGLKLLQNN